MAVKALAIIVGRVELDLCGLRKVAQVLHVKVMEALHLRADTHRRHRSERAHWHYKGSSPSTALLRAGQSLREWSNPIALRKTVDKVGNNYSSILDKCRTTLRLANTETFEQHDSGID